MKVLLNRAMYLGKVFYERDINGTEIPDEVDGKKVVLYSEEAKKNDKVVVLPQDVKLFTVPGVAKASDLLHNAKQEPVALSELSKKK